jgi:DNA helicase-2/ATP-dependent DNA helicase PcrA
VLNGRISLSALDEQVGEKLDGIGFRDHSICAEYRVFGPPGTGKTLNLARQVRRAVDRFGDNSALVTSFSRAAAAELAARHVSLDSHQIGTLHSHCFHALGRPALAEDHVADWNRRNPALPITPVSRARRMDGEDWPEDDHGQVKRGDSQLQKLNRCRGMMLMKENWPAEVHDFSKKWAGYKRANGLYDFCDLIEIALRDVSVAPGNPDVVVADEAQDLNRMQLAVIRRWGRSAKYLVLALDDDQTIYSWAGASPDAILDADIPDDHKIFLKQSVRVPRSIHALAERWIRQVSRREQKTYLPRPADGELHRLSNAGYRSPEYWILKSAKQHMKQAHTIMFLASCSYMLWPIIAVLRKNGIPFHNPYRKSNGHWNPLRAGSQSSAVNRVLSLLAGHAQFDGLQKWTWGELESCAEWLRDRVLKPAWRDLKLGKQTEVTPEILQAVLEPAAYESFLLAANQSPLALLSWWQRRLAPEFESRIDFPTRIVTQRGPNAFQNPPQVIVGTIHSVKGGQADVVYLFPDISKAADAHYQRVGALRDAVIRLFYVGATRARETLYICSRESAMAVPI